MRGCERSLKINLLSAVGAAAARALPAGLILSAWAGAATFAQDAGPADAAAHGAFIESYCAECHNFEDWAGGVAFDTMDFNNIGADAEIWETAVMKLRGRLMPPSGEPQPDQAEIDSVVGYLEASIDRAAAAERHAGHVPIHRLNRTEFSIAVKDLLGVDVDPSQILPTEIEVEGFENIAGALNVSPAFLEQHLAASRLAARLAVGDPAAKLSNTYYRAPSSGGQGGFGGQTTYNDGFPLGTRGGMQFSHVFPADGEYRFNILDVDAGLYPRGMETGATMVILVDGVEQSRVSIGGPEDMNLADRDGPDGRAAIIAKVSGLPAQVEAGTHEVTVTFIERSWAQSNNASGGGRVSGMPRVLDGVEVEGPFDPAGVSLSESRAKIFVCQPASEAEEGPCAEEIARRLATRAFRRPVTDEDIAWLMPFYEEGRVEAGSFDAGVTELVTAILASPDFLYRTIAPAEAPEGRRLDDLELASRLSFFLWSQGPDEALIELAAAGGLSDPAAMQAEVGRMLADPRANALVENFALSWLNLDDLDEVDPQTQTFNAQMRTNFEIEIRQFLASVLLEDRSVMELLTADYTFVNEGLARHYGVEGVHGPQFRRVTLDDENRWGLLGKGAMLLRTSYGDRTSPVLRGAWVLDKIMGTPPAPPPPNVETDLSIQEGEAPTTVRARLEQHRADASCKACHGAIDPLGLALENFDNAGAWRDVDMQANAPIDATTELVSGAVLSGPSEMRAYLTRRPDQFAQNITERLMMYALGREIEYYDMPTVRSIVRSAAEENYTLSSIVTGIVNSDAFRLQGPEEPMDRAEAAEAPRTP